MDKITVKISDSCSIEGEFDPEQNKVVFCKNGKFIIVEKEEEVAHNILQFRLRQSITSLYKNFLILVEDLREEYNGNMSRLLENVPEDAKLQVFQADFFNEEKFQYLRKKILSSGNDTIRNLESELENFSLSFNIQDRNKNEKT